MTDKDVSKWIQLPRQKAKGRAEHGPPSAEEPWQVIMCCADVCCTMTCCADECYIMTCCAVLRCAVPCHSILCIECSGALQC